MRITKGPRAKGSHPPNPEALLRLSHRFLPDNDSVLKTDLSLLLIHLIRW